MLKRLLFFNVVLLSVYISCYAQLNKLCPVSSTVLEKQIADNMYLLLNTKDFTSIFVPGAKSKFTSTVQLINAAHPFPPLWYQMGNPKTDTGGVFESTFLSDIKIQQFGGGLTFSGSYPGYIKGAITFDTATLQPTDTLAKYKLITPYDIKEFLNLHDYEIDAQGNKLVSCQLQKKIDIRCLTGLEQDSARPAMVNDIIILNQNDSIIFYWDAIKHMSPCEMKWEYRNQSLMYGDVINWSHLNSLKFANDGNIIYSFRHIGLGKINRKTGETMWKLGGKDSVNAIPLADTAGYYLQHNFIQREDGLYSVFSNGDGKHPYLEALVFDIDEVKKEATLVSRYRPQPEMFSKALGSYDCLGDTCVINFGMYTQVNQSAMQEIAHILVDNKLAAILSAPSMNFAYQIHQTKWTAVQRRPKIVVKKEVLYADPIAGLHNYNWYKIEDSTAIPVGTGETFTPTISGKYVVEAKQGTGLFKSFLVSDVFVFTKKKK